MTAPMIEIDSLVKRFGSFTAVDGVTFSVPKGEVLGFLGPNGAGKSTTMRMITGYLTATSGHVRIAGVDVGEDPKKAQGQIGYLPEGAPAYADMTPYGFLAFIAAARGIARAQRADAIAKAAERTGLAPVMGQRIDTLSKGFKRRVGLAQAILADPPVLILDEPTDGLDPNQKHAVRGLISAMAREKAIILSTHILEEVEAVCTRALILDRGRIVADGTPAELEARSRYHNAVTVVVTSADAERARTAFRLHTSVLGHEERDAGGGRTAFTLIARPGRVLMETIPAALKEKGIEPVELIAERGRLDEVFRALTTPDTALAKGAAA